MKNCLNCAYCNGRDVRYCSITSAKIPHPFFMGGKKCECYEKIIRRKERFVYPDKGNATYTMMAYNKILGYAWGLAKSGEWPNKQGERRNRENEEKE